MGKIGKCCCATTCETACPVHSAKTSYTATTTGLVVPFEVTLDQSTNPTQKCFFAGTACHRTSWTEKSTHETGSSSWGPFTWPFLTPQYTIVLSTSATNCDVGFPSSHPTQRRWQSSVLTNQKFRLIQQDRYQLSIDIINYGPLNQLALTATFNFRFCSTWQAMIGLAARWRYSDTRWDDPTFDWVVTNGSDNVDTIPSSPSFPSVPYRQDVIGYVPDLSTCNWDYATDDYLVSWPQKEVGRWDKINNDGGPCELDVGGDVAVNVIEPGWETRLFGTPPSICGAIAGLGYNASYTYESDPFPCDAIPSSIQMKKYPSYTDVTGYTDTFTTPIGGCGTWTTVRDYITIPKDFYVALS
ncbi:hypothetical protein VN12_19510 [Pirellula sp. SH-Sr6A]|nr:hypothetical protein VN12_19510 [Pirellula sp. SH-Sr6A]